MSRKRPNLPWCCWVSFGGPHEPWDTPEPYASQFDPALSPPPLPRLADHDSIGGLARRAFDSPRKSPPKLTPEQIMLMRANYAGGAALIDHQIGIILDVLRARSQLDNTIVAFTSDHGEMNGDQRLIYKSTFFEPAIRVPLIIRTPPDWPGPKGVVLDSPVALIDLSTTLVDLVGGLVPSTFCGSSLRPTVEGQEAQHRAFALSELDHHYCIIGRSQKVEFDPDLSIVAAFDLETDPGEQHNMAEPIPNRTYFRDLLNDVVTSTPAGDIPITIEPRDEWQSPRERISQA